MNNNLMVFDNEEFGQVRVITKENNHWFVALDICKVLDIDVSVSVNGQRRKKNGIEYISGGLDEDEKDTHNVSTPGGNQEMIIISEAGLYSLVLKSRKPEAKKFKRWVTHTVLPTIRKTGGYVANDDLFINTYLPFADDPIKALFKSTLMVINNQNKVIQDQRKEIEDQKKDIGHKEGVIVGLVEDITIAEKRQILNRVVRRCSNYQDRWRELYRQYEMKFRLNLNTRFKTYNLEHKPKLRNRLDYIDKVLNQIPELYSIACKLYENDVNELIEEMYSLQENKSFA